MYIGYKLQSNNMYMYIPMFFHFAFKVLKRKMSIV